eukprot:m.404650 g.404650  ORF g.404650 m.404650 type:complete len:556 (-) comp21199_c0_seq1:176-1843(-)
MDLSSRNAAAQHYCRQYRATSDTQIFCVFVLYSFTYSSTAGLLSPWALCETYNGGNITHELQKQLIAVSQCLTQDQYVVSGKTALGMALHRGRISPHAISNEVSVSRNFTISSDDIVAKFNRCKLHLFVEDGDYLVCFLQKSCASIATSKNDAPWKQRNIFVPFTTLHADLSLNTEPACRNISKNVSKDVSINESKYESKRTCVCQVQQQHVEVNNTISVFDDNCTDQKLSALFGNWKQATVSTFLETEWQRDWHEYFRVQYALSKRWRYCELYTGNNISQALHDQLGVVAECFRQKGIPYYVSYGTLLGIVRDGGINPYEVDNDIVIPLNFTITPKMYRFMESFNLHLFMDGIPRLCYKAAEPHTLDAPWGQSKGYMVYSDVYPFLPFFPVEFDYFDSGKNKSNLLNFSYGVEEVRVGNITVRTYDNVTARLFMRRKYKNYNMPPLQNGSEWKSYWHYKIANITPAECNNITDTFACTRVNCTDNQTAPRCPGHCASFCIPRKKKLGNTTGNATGILHGTHESHGLNHYEVAVVVVGSFVMVLGIVVKHFTKIR